MSQFDTAGNEINYAPPLCCSKQTTSGYCPVHSPAAHNQNDPSAQPVRHICGHGTFDKPCEICKGTYHNAVFDPIPSAPAAQPSQPDAINHDQIRRDIEGELANEWADVDRTGWTWDHWLHVKLVAALKEIRISNSLQANQLTAESFARFKELNRKLGKANHGEVLAQPSDPRGAARDEKVEDSKIHITGEWDENWNPVCLPDCPGCKEIKREQQEAKENQPATPSSGTGKTPQPAISAESQPPASKRRENPSTALTERFRWCPKAAWWCPKAALFQIPALDSTLPQSDSPLTIWRYKSCSRALGNLATMFCGWLEFGESSLGWAAASC